MKDMFVGTLNVCTLHFIVRLKKIVIEDIFVNKENAHEVVATISNVKII